MSYIDEVAAAVERAIPFAQRPSSDAESLYRIYALLALTRGQATTLEDVHDAWSVWMTQRGENHPSLVPFADLSAEVQAEDRVFMDAIHEVAAQHSVR